MKMGAYGAEYAGEYGEDMRGDPDVERTRANAWNQRKADAALLRLASYWYERGEVLITLRLVACFHDDDNYGYSGSEERFMRALEAAAREAAAREGGRGSWRSVCGRRRLARILWRIMGPLCLCEAVLVKESDDVWVCPVDGRRWRADSIALGDLSPAKNISKQEDP